MSHTNICNSKKVDYFVLDSTQEHYDASEGSINPYFLFKEDGTFIGMHDDVPLSGKWNEDTITLVMNEDEMPISFTIDGDLLKLILGEEPDAVEYYRRNNAENPILDLPDGDATIEIDVTDGNNAGRISVYCPKGWYYYQQLSDKGSIKLSTTPDPRMTGVIVTITHSTFQNAKFTLEGKEQTRSYGDKKWFCKDGDMDEYITIIGNNAITVTVTGGYSNDLTEQILPSINLTGNIRDNSAICEDKDEDIFKARHVEVNYDALPLEQLQKLDYWICFRKDGTVTLKLDKSITAALEETLGDTLTGTWENETIHIPKIDQTSYLPIHIITFTLEGDILSLSKQGDTRIYFHRCK